MAALITTDTSEFAVVLPVGGKLAGLDVGTKTVGIAICDAGWHFAGPAETIRRTQRLDVRISVLPGSVEVLGPAVEVDNFEGITVLDLASGSGLNVNVAPGRAFPAGSCFFTRIEPQIDAFTGMAPVVSCSEALIPDEDRDLAVISPNPGHRLKFGRNAVMSM